MPQPANPPASDLSTLRPRPDVELGRRAEVRVEKFIDAATEVFAEKGYRHARLSDIVARAGGSLATLYRAFGDKEGLAYAILERRLEDLMQRLHTLDLSGQSPEQALHLTAELIADNLARPDSRILHRIVIGEGQSFPQLRDWYFDHTVAAIRSRLGEYFEQEAAAGRLRLASPSSATNQFYMMLFGDWIIRVACGAAQTGDAEQLRAYARDAVDLFLHGALPR